MKYVALSILLALAGTASADDKDKADKLFKHGKKLMEQKHYADACAAFEQSAQLDPGIGVQLNIGLCYEEWGKLALAWRSFVKAEQMASDSKDSRLARIHERVQELDQQVPRLTVRVPDGADVEALAIVLDGKPLDPEKVGKQQLVDPGPHLVEYTVDGQKKTKVIPIERGANAAVTLDAPVGGGKPHKDKPEREVVRTTPHDPGRTQRIAAIATGGAGVVAMGVAVGVAFAARSSYRNALATDCNGSTTMCDPTGLSETHSARTNANIATVVFAIGGAAVATGAVLYLIAPHAKRSTEHALYVAPTLGGLVLGGGF